MCKVKITAECVWFCIFAILGVIAVLLNTPSLHSGLSAPEDFDWFEGSSELNRQCQLAGNHSWTPLYRLYSNNLNWKNNQTHGISVNDLHQIHFSHVYQTIQDEQLADDLSRYIAKYDAKMAQNMPINEIDPASETAFYDGRWRAFLVRMQESLADPIKLQRSVFDSLLTVPDTDHFVSEIKGLRVHFSLTQFPQSKVKGKKSKPRLGVLLLNGWPSNANEWSQMLKTIKESGDLINKCSVYPVFVTVSLPSMGGTLSEIAYRKTFGDFNLFSLTSIMRELMEHTLSNMFDQYIVIGTDWGSLLAEFISISQVNRALPLVSEKNRKLRAILVAMPVSQPPILESILMQMSPVFTDYFLQDEMEHIQELYRKRGKQGALLGLLSAYWDGTAYQHWMNTRPHTAAHVLTSNLVAYSAFIFEKYMIWSSISNDTDEVSQTRLFDQIISTAVLSYTNPAGIEGGISYYRENIAMYLLRGAKVMTPAEIPVYASVMGMDPFGKRTVDRYLKLRYQGLKRIFRHPTVGHFPSIDDPNAIVQDLFQTIENVARNYLNDQSYDVDNSPLKQEV